MSYHKSKTSILSSLDKDYIEEGRKDIYKWGETRKTKRKGIRGWAYSFKKLFIDKGILKSFINNLTVSLAIQLILSGLITYTCQRLDLYLDVNIALFVSPIVFPLAFSINADFQRREHVLEDLALFKGGLIVLFFCHRDWHVPAGLNQEFLKAVTNKLKGLILNIKEYLLTEKLSKRNFILKVIYEDFSDISQMNEKLRVALPESASLVQRLVHCHNLMFWAFERLRVVREYRSPRGIRSFTKVFIFIMPLVLSPYYVFVGKSSSNEWGPYYISLISTFIFGTLQGVQDVLDDPFDGISEDDVNLGSLEDWTAHSLLTNRTYTIGRFTVTTSFKPKEMDDNREIPDSVTFESQILDRHSKNPSFNKKKANMPMKSILRRTSHRPEVSRLDSLSEVSEKDVDILYPEMASRLQRMKTKDITGSTTILPRLQVKDRPPSIELVDDDSICGIPASLRRSKSDVSETHARRRAFKKNVSFSRDMEDEINSIGSERNSDSPTNDNSPLIRQSAKDNIAFRFSDPDPDEIPKNLRATFDQLRNSSSTDRVMQTRQPQTKSKTPASLSNLFNPPEIRSQGESPKSTPTLCLSTMFDPLNSKEVTSNNDVRQPPLIELPTVTVQPRSRFSVSNLERSGNSEPTGSAHDDGQKSPIPAEISNKDIGPKVSRFAVAPAAMSTPSKDSPVNHVNVKLPSSSRFQVKKTPSSEEPEDEKLGQRNLAMSSPSSSSIEDAASNNQAVPTNKPSRFSVSKPPKDIPTCALPEPKKPRKEGFWDFDGSSENLASSDSGSKDGIDGIDTKRAELQKPRKSSSIEEVLDLGGKHKEEVYI